MDVEYFKTNHVIIVKTHGQRCIRSVFNKLGYGKHTPKNFSALTLKHKNPSATVIIFSTGTITIMGPKTYWGAMYVLATLKYKLDLDIYHVKLTNVVVKFYQPRRDMDIGELYDWNKQDCDCDMNLFPSCNYLVPDTRIKANFFKSGKVVVTGSRSEEVAEHILKHLLYLIERFHAEKVLTIDDKNMLVVSIENNQSQNDDNETDAM